MSEYINVDQLWKCETCFYHRGGKCTTWCDALESYRPAYDKLKFADVAPVVYGLWECVYDDSTGETDITCSNCKNTRTVNGCFVSTDGKSCYFEDDYCPNCGCKMAKVLCPAVECIHRISEDFWW